MSRFLQERHYKLVLPGVKLLVEQRVNPELMDCVLTYMDRTSCSYTQEDAEYIHKLYVERYGAVPSKK